MGVISLQERRKARSVGKGDGGGASSTDWHSCPGQSGWVQPSAREKPENYLMSKGSRGRRRQANIISLASHQKVPQTGGSLTECGFGSVCQELGSG